MISNRQRNNLLARNVPRLYKDTIKQKNLRGDRSFKRNFVLMMGVLLMIIGTLINYFFLNLGELGFDAPESILSIEVGSDSRDQPLASSSAGDSSGSSWCDRVKAARESLGMAHLRVSYPCEGMKPATSAIVCMLTDGASEAKANRIVFTARDYINGAMSLGASLQDSIDHSQTHQLLLLREGFELEQSDLIRLKAVGWVIGTAPNFPLEPKYIPKFPRYKTTYTKVTAIGMSEYDCVMLMDADTLVVGDLKDVMKCDSVFKHPNNRVGGTIDWYHMGWKLFNTGSILWRTDSGEMERVFNLTRDPTFMRKFGSDQDFLNNVYPDRLRDTNLNNEIVALDTAEARSNGNAIDPVVPHETAKTGAVVPLSWDYNAQTHAEVQHSSFWQEHRPTVRILHFTEKKGWQCERSTADPPPLSEMPTKCNKKIPICFCREAHLYWRALEQAEKASQALLAAAEATAKR